MPTSALDAALRAYGQPLAHKASATTATLPGVLDVIKIAAGDPAAVEHAKSETGMGEAELTEAAAFYLQGILLVPRQTPHGLLCLPENAAAADVTLHKRWLLKWLHPDRNHNKWQATLFQRVTAAANALNSRAANTDVATPAAAESAATDPALPEKANRRNKGGARPRAAWKATQKRQRHFDGRQWFMRIVRKVAIVSAFVVLAILATRTVSQFAFWHAVGAQGSGLTKQ